MSILKNRTVYLLTMKVMQEHKQLDAHCLDRTCYPAATALHLLTTAMHTMT